MPIRYELLPETPGENVQRCSFNHMYRNRKDNVVGDHVNLAGALPLWLLWELCRFLVVVFIEQCHFFCHFIMHAKEDSTSCFLSPLFSTACSEFFVRQYVLRLYYLYYSIFIANKLCLNFANCIYLMCTYKKMLLIYFCYWRNDAWANKKWKHSIILLPEFLQRFPLITLLV